MNVQSNNLFLVINEVIGKDNNSKLIDKNISQVIKD